MDVEAPFRKDVFQPLVQVLAPGAFLFIPILLLFREHLGDDEFKLLVSANEWVTIAAIFLAVVALGVVLENVGSQIEVRFFDRWLFEKRNCHYDDWNEYLMLTFAVEPVGQRYLRSILLRMKFELSMAAAAFFSAIAWASFHIVAFSWDVSVLNRAAGLLLTAGSFIGVSVYFVWEAYQAAGVLSDVRHHLVCSYGDEKSAIARSTLHHCEIAERPPLPPARSAKWRRVIVLIALAIFLTWLGAQAGTR